MIGLDDLHSPSVMMGGIGGSGTRAPGPLQLCCDVRHVTLPLKQEACENQTITHLST